MKTKLIIFVISLIASMNALHGQQVPLFSQYLFNGFLVNPAYAGLDGLSAVNLTAREQWVGLAGAPQTHLLSYQTRLLKNSFVKKSASARRKALSTYTSGRVGVGGYIFNERKGIINRTGGQMSYSYHLKLYNGALLSMAISGSVHQFYINQDKISTTSATDKLTNNNSLNLIIPDAGVGIVYSNKTLYGGISIDQLLQSYLKLGKDATESNYQLFRQYNFTFGYRYEINKLTAIEPSCLVKTSNFLLQKTTDPSKIPQVDVSLKYIFQRDYWAGVSVRTGYALVIMGGLTYERYHFGYSFDYSLSSLQKYNYGSHELMVAYKFGDNASRLRWLNR